jgi:hypothetical protein
VVRAWVDWDAVRAGPEPAVLIVDESSKAEQVHLLRVSLAYRGGSLPLAWRVWRQNVPLPRGAYGAQLRAVLAEAAGIVPPDVAVVVTADRAYDVPLFVDAVAAQGWAWVVRAKARSTLRWRDHQGAEQELRGVLARRVGRPGQRWKAHGQVFKKAGWRAASVVGYWAPGQQEPLVVLTSLPPQWTVLARYGRRFWIEPGFRSDKSKGWHWEDSQITDLTHQERLLLGMAWASLLVLCLGAQAAAAQVQAAAQPGALRPGRPRAARESLFSLGVRWLRRWTYQPTALTPQWRLDALGAPAWGVQWRAVQAQRVLPLPRAAPARPPAAPLSRAA